MDSIRKILEAVAKEHPYKIPSRRETYDKYNEGWTDAVDKIESMLPEQTEREKGEWLFVHPLQTSDMGAYMCSVCEHGDFDIKPSSYKFCPYCGAKMKHDWRADE